MKKKLSAGDQQVVQDEADATVRADAAQEVSDKADGDAFEQAIAGLPHSTQEVMRQQRKEKA